MALEIDNQKKRVNRKINIKEYINNQTKSHNFKEDSLNLIFWFKMEVTFQEEQNIQKQKGNSSNNKRKITFQDELVTGCLE